MIVVCALLALSACTPGSGRSSAVREVRIGLLGSLSAPGTGQAAARGAQLAALVVNQSQSLALPLAGATGLPGLDGAQIRIVQADTRGDSNAAVEAATRLVADQRVVGLVSADPAQATALASERTERIGVPFLGSFSSANFLTERGLDWYFRVTPSDQLVAEASLALLARSSDPKTAMNLGIVHASDEASRDSATAVEGLAAEANARVADGGNQAFGSGQGARGAVTQVRNAKPSPDAMVAVASQPNDAKALITAGALNGTVSVAIGAGFTPQAVRDAGLRTGGQVLHGAAWSPDFAARNLAANAVASLYQRRFNAPMTEAAAETFTAVLTLAQAVNAARSVDAQAIRTALLGLNVPGRDTIMPWGGIRFDQTGQNVEATALVEKITPDVAQVVFPQELAGDDN